MGCEGGEGAPRRVGVAASANKLHMKRGRGRRKIGIIGILGHFINNGIIGVYGMSPLVTGWVILHRIHEEVGR